MTVNFDDNRPVRIVAEFVCDDWTPLLPLPFFAQRLPHFDEWAEDWWSTPPKPKKIFTRANIPMGALVKANPRILGL